MIKKKYLLGGFSVGCSVKDIYFHSRRPTVTKIRITSNTINTIAQTGTLEVSAKTG